MPEMSDPICVISNNQKTETVAFRDSGTDTQKMLHAYSGIVGKPVGDERAD